MYSKQSVRKSTTLVSMHQSARDQKN